MLFNSLIFLYAFLPITYFVFWKLRTKDQRFIWLTITGYVFYGFWNWKFCFLMLFSTLVSYLAGLGMLKYTQDSRRRKLFLVIPICVDLLVLGYFKYANFLLDTGAGLLSLISAQPVHAPHYQIVLPVGISFYTFHTASYIVDSYRRVVTPTRNFFEFSCYVSLFSQLVAGPIVRFREVERDLDRIDNAERWNNLETGISFFIVGLAKKVLVADTIAAVIDPAFSQASSGLSTADAWLCSLGYAYQIYFDFSGYSDMAVGLGRMFGIHIPQNFNSPYQALNPSDFWRRWHISLSTCMRDYLYIPMGGNRGSPLRVNMNLFATMLIGGLWHGANWTFVLWGAYHGSLLILYRQIGPAYDRMPPALQRGLMFLLVVIGWVPFRAESLHSTTLIWKSLLGLSTSARIVDTTATLVAALAVAAALSHLGKNPFEWRHRWTRWQVGAWGACFLVCLIVIASGENSPFLYFQF